MSKRTPGLPQRPRGFWPTPPEAVAPLIPYLPSEARYIEPCAGDGSLIHALKCLWPNGVLDRGIDIEPQAEGITACDARAIFRRPDLFITNPPWPVIGGRGKPALPIIRHLCQIAPLWALLPWDFAAADYYCEVAPWCAEIVPLGRVSWLNNGQGGKDNSAWYRFDAQHRAPTILRSKAAP